jgi:hypothetical protein
LQHPFSMIAASTSKNSVHPIATKWQTRRGAETLTWKPQTLQLIDLIYDLLLHLKTKSTNPSSSSSSSSLHCCPQCLQLHINTSTTYKRVIGCTQREQIQHLTKQLAPNCNQTKMTINPRASKCRKQSTYLPETQQIGSLHDDDDDDGGSKWRNVEWPT